jgi:glutamate-1-semialdehyde 2,1-aminomutase
MDLFGSGQVMHGGTYNSQSIGMAATVATLNALRQPGTYDRLERQGTRLMRGIDAAVREAGVTATVTGFPQIFHLGFGLASPPRNYRDVLVSDRATYVRFTTRLLERGVRALERGGWFISTEHDDGVIDETLAAVEDALVGP